MTNQEKRDLIQYCKAGYSFIKIRKLVYCSDVTIRHYMKIFAPTPEEG